jgi:hypothetical protein
MTSARLAVIVIWLATLVLRETCRRFNRNSPALSPFQGLYFFGSLTQGGTAFALGYPLSGF